MWEYTAVWENNKKRPFNIPVEAVRSFTHCFNILAFRNHLSYIYLIIQLGEDKILKKIIILTYWQNL